MLIYLFPPIVWRNHSAQVTERSVCHRRDGCGCRHLDCHCARCVGHASASCSPSASACIDLTHSTAWLQSGGTTTYGPVPITSGKAGERTPAGEFTVFWRDKNHKSSLFNDAPMANSVFFNGDIAFHEGSLRVESNGCVHLSVSASEAFFNTLRVGDTVSAFGVNRG